MDVTTTQDVIDELEKVRRRTRADRRVSSVPLLTFGVFTLVDAAIRAASNPYRSMYWVLAAPAGFAFVAWYYRRHEASVGVGSDSDTYRWWALGVLAALMLAPFLVLFGAPQGLIAIGLVTIAVRQNNVYLGAWAAVYGVVGVLDGWYVVTNRLYDLASWLGLYSETSGYFDWAPALVTGVLGLMLVGAGLLALRKEAWGSDPSS